MKKSKLIRLQDVVMGAITVSSLFLLLNVSGVYATGATDEVTVTIPESCSLTSTVTTAHTATVENGVYNDSIGETSISAFCNDSEGFSVYAVGYTNDEYGNNTMKPNTIAASNAITTGLATSGDTSNWAMKLTSASENFALTNDFSSFHVIPDTYTKVATYPSNTTSVSGVQVKSTYAVYASQTQPADSYTGKVKYTIVHPANTNAPITPVATMQNMDSSVCTSSPKYVVDNRDDHIYTIQRLLDGECWMMDNLDLGRTDLTTDLTSDNTNLATTISAATFNGWKVSSGSNTYDAGEFIPLTTSNTSNGLDADPVSGITYGTLYNYYAASAGTVSGSSNNRNAQYDICPAGWRLPYGGNYGEIKGIYGEYNSYSLMRAPIAQNGVQFALVGHFNTGAPIDQGKYGYYWSSGVKDYENTKMYNFLHIATNYLYTNFSSNRGEGGAIRCRLKKTISDISYMQDFYNISSNDKATVIDSMKEGVSYSLIDNRDNKAYTIAKLKDGNVWMIENLDLGRTNLTTDLTYKNTNLSNNITAATFNSWRKESGESTYDAGEYIPLTTSNSSDGLDADSVSGTPYGTLYNYYAASAGTVSGSSNSSNAQFDICPAGWRLPTGNTSGELGVLYTKYGSEELFRASFADNGAQFAFAGNFDSGVPRYQGDNSYYWSSSRDSSTNMTNLFMVNSYGSASFSSDRRYGYAIRCLVKKLY